MTRTALSLTVLALMCACTSETDRAAEPDADLPDVTQPPCEGPLGPAVNPDALPACCPSVGGAHCVPAESIPPELRDQVAACDHASVCVPDEFISTGGVFTPRSCVSLAGEPGACMSRCLPEVQKFEAALPQDACADHERCAPCINPLTGMDSGACNLAFSCE